MGDQVFIDGKFYPRADAKVSVFDHGFLYGDGIFEGIRSYDGLIFRLDDHLDRLFESAHSIMLNMPMTKRELKDVTIKALQVNKLKDAYIRLIVSRGVGDLGLDPKKCPKATVVLIADKIRLYPAEFYEKGMEIITVPTVRNLPEALNPQIKTLNYLNNIMAKIEANNAGCKEALMLNHLGYVVEGTGDNIFMIKKGKMITPPSFLGALKGITRGVIIDIALKKKMDFAEKLVTRHDLFNADEVFLTGTAAEVIPIVKIDGRMIGGGKPGKYTAELTADFRKLTKTDGLRYEV